jgi:cell fate (sporulation/competence/biofilm development) regulator YlbF (YheA/YmcA/DUF963 family)
MEKVIEKAFELAKAIAESDEIRELRMAERSLLNNPETYELFRELKQFEQLLNLTNSEEYRNKYQKTLEKLSETEEGKKYIEATRKLAQMIDTVNSILQQAIEPQGHSCSGCSGCQI